MPKTTLYGHDVDAAIAAYTSAHAQPSETRPGCFESESLCAVQSYLWRVGYREAEVLSTAYGYSLRHASGLENFALIASARRHDVDGSLADALRAAEQWVAVDPTRRTVYTRDLLPSADAVHLVFEINTAERPTFSTLHDEHVIELGSAEGR